MKVYPIGYSLHGARERVDELMANSRMLLIDTRHKPYSWRHDWKGPELRQRYGERYHWAGQYLGNVNYQGGPIQLADPATGIRGLIMYLREGYDLILLCQCPAYEACHRKVIVDLLLKAMPEVEVIQQTEMQGDMIKCLSIRQPYASWIANPQWFRSHGVPIKCIENRDWQTNYRGPLLIHASKQFENDAFGYWLDYLDGLENCVSADRRAYPTGAIVGIANLVDCVSRSDDPWFVGDYGFVLANARPIDPIPYTGSLRLFDVPRSLVVPALPLAG